MFRQSRCNIAWIDPDINSKLAHIFTSDIGVISVNPIHELLVGLDIVITPQIEKIANHIILSGLTEEGFKLLHQAIFTGPIELGGSYRSIVMIAGESQFVDFWNIQKEMELLFNESYTSIGMILYWMIETLGRIHPFVDMNRRTVFLAADLHMISLGLRPVNWGKNRIIWENARIESKNIDSKKRLQILMKSLLDPAI